MSQLKDLTRTFWGVFTAVLIGSILLAAFSYSMVAAQNGPPTLSITHPTPPALPTATATIGSPLPSVQDSSSILGIDGNAGVPYAGVPWVRLGYPTCGNGDLRGNVLRNAILGYHRQGVRVMLSICQQSVGPSLFDATPLNDAAQGGADAVQCGNEQMKIDAATRYITPQHFAKYFDLCQSAIHAVHPEIPVILGSLDPHVGGVDNQQLADQVHYLDTMQQAMNTEVHPGGNWSWRSQIVGLIDSWHNGYPNASVNNLYALFLFWAQQFHANLNNGELGKHLWVIEGTGCFKGCGIDATSPYQVAVSHILTLIIDVQTTTKYHVPFFYFSGKDFVLGGILWPIGVLNIHNQPKPIRQDLAMGSRTLTLSCSSARVSVVAQEQLLAHLYSGCTLPSDYVSTLAS